MSRRPRIVACTAAAFALLAAPAAAHPAFDPNQVPGGELIAAELVVPHGCGEGGGMPHDGGGLPTEVFELQLTDAVTSFEGAPKDGWIVEHGDGSVTWTADGGQTTDPIVFDVTFTVVGETGETIHLGAFQGCDGSEFRWIGTPDAPAEYPAVALTLTTGAEPPAVVPSPSPEEATEPDAPAGEGAVADERTVAASEPASDAGSPIPPIAVALLSIAIVGLAAVFAVRGKG